MERKYCHACGDDFFQNITNLDTRVDESRVVEPNDNKCSIIRDFVRNYIFSYIAEDGGFLKVGYLCETAVQTAEFAHQNRRTNLIQNHQLPYKNRRQNRRTNC